MPLIPALKRQLELGELEVSLGCIAVPGQPELRREVMSQNRTNKMAVLNCHPLLFHEATINPFPVRAHYAIEAGLDITGYAQLSG